MSKQVITNTWNDGLNKDLNPVITPNTVLTDNLNGTFITYNGNELVLQNDMGNSWVAGLSEGFYPIGISEFGDIMYIVSIRNTTLKKIYVTENSERTLSEIKAEILEKLQNLTNRDIIVDDLLSPNGWIAPNEYLENLIIRILDETVDIEHTIEENASTKFEIGSFPSLDPTIDEEQPFENKYRPLHNLITLNGESEYLDNFSTNLLIGYSAENPVTIEAQSAYDGSVNLILTDGKNPPRLINSGFAVTKNGNGVFIKRNQNEKTNYYRETRIDELTRLINVSTTFPKVDLGYTYNENGQIIKISGVQQGGQLKGGNYTFYFKFGDEDGNKTDIVCESGIVSIFKGVPGDPSTISGAFSNEITDKLVHLKVSNIDTTYSRLYVYYTREYCDLNGYRLVECKELLEPFKISKSSEVISISGVENTNDISIEELNIYYHTVTSAKAIAQQQNILFLGNITNDTGENVELQKCSYDIKVTMRQGQSIGAVNTHLYRAQSLEMSEYYNPDNIYYNLGYWPDELYRLGVVYIKSDGSTTQVFNLRGCWFHNVNESNQLHQYDQIKSKDNIFIDGNTDFDNITGVFKTPDINVLKNGSVQPLYFEFVLSDELSLRLQALGIVGYFVVRQKRIPITICQGYGIGVDKGSYIPMIQNADGKYIAESFITENYRLIYNPIEVSYDGTISVGGWKPELYIIYTVNVYIGGGTKYQAHLCGPRTLDDLDHIFYWGEKECTTISEAAEICREYYETHRLSYFDALFAKFAEDNGIEVLINLDTPFQQVQRNSNNATYDNDSTDKRREINTAQTLGNGLLSVEAMVNPQIQSLLSGSKFTLDPTNQCNIVDNWPMYYAQNYNSTDESSITAKLVYIPEGTQLKYIDEQGFSTQVGDGVNPGEFGFLVQRSKSDETSGGNFNIVRGLYTPYIASIAENEENTVKPNLLYNIRVPHENKSDFIVRSNNSSEYYAITDRLSITDSTNVYRGDCFTNTVTVRMHRNFIDSTAPIADKIVNPEAWSQYYFGYSNVAGKDDEDKLHKTQWENINVGDLNTVSLGHWITFKCLSSSNLGLRSEDTFHSDEMALMGNARSFYPLVGASTATGMKLEESKLLNDGYNATVGRKRNTLKKDTPFDKNEFSNRIIFSNVSVTDSFTNGYRVFQGLSYKDYTKQYGSIIKLIPWGNNLFCTFEHGLAIIPINEKALMQTTTEQTIHIFGHDVLPDQLSIISQDFGSIWADSVIRTPVGIYGVDTYAKKIWRFTDKNGLETLSDLKLQRFLNDNINLDRTKSETIGYTNVKTHFNNYKGDVMFTFYHKSIKWNLCYNERQSLWVTRYDWIPMHSCNINNTFYSIPLEPYSETMISSIWKHGRTTDDGLFRPTKWYGKQHPFEFEFVVTEPMGIHKIFEDLMIVSNNVQPYEIDFEVVGDAYLFNKARIYHDVTNIYGNHREDKPYKIFDEQFTKSDYDKTNFRPMFYNAIIRYDDVLDQYNLVVSQTCKNVETYGRRLGNIQYKEDGWYLNIEPLRYNVNLNNPNISEFAVTDRFASTKIRDKWLKIRIKYTGDQLALINGVSTFENISYA